MLQLRGQMGSMNILVMSCCMTEVTISLISYKTLLEYRGKVQCPNLKKACDNKKQGIKIFQGLAIGITYSETKAAVYLVDP